MSKKFNNPYEYNPCDSCCYGGYCEYAEIGGRGNKKNNDEKSDIWRAGYRSGRDEQREFIRENPDTLIKIYGAGPIDVSKFVSKFVSKLSEPDLDRVGELCTERLAKIKERRGNGFIHWHHKGVTKRVL